MITANSNSYTFNIVINVSQANWARSYAARGYIIYKFGGETYTVYDSKYSVRNVQYVLVQQANDLSKYYAHWYAIHICNFMANHSSITLNKSCWGWSGDANKWANADGGGFIPVTKTWE